MREIKFRVFDPNTNNMIATEIGVGKIYLYDFDGDNITEQEGLIIMQYTGLKDKNGNDIYEGDIITGNSYGDDYPLIIKWDYEYSGFYCHDPKGDDEDHLNMQEAVNGTVIGNIYENPELVKL